MNMITCSESVLAQTIQILQAGGQRSEEHVVLWLASSATNRDPTPVAEVYDPAQITAIDYFRLPPESLRALMAHLRAKRLKIVAQVHSHPGEAFHSEADNEWAVIRQVGSLSLVLPHFARGTTPASFGDQAVTYQLSSENEWVWVPNAGPAGYFGAVR